MVPSPAMKIQIKIKEVAQAKGLTTAYQLQKKAKLMPSTASRLYRNQVSQITIKTLGKLCEHLECGPEDLLVWPRKARAKGKKI